MIEGYPRPKVEVEKRSRLKVLWARLERALERARRGPTISETLENIEQEARREIDGANRTIESQRYLKHMAHGRLRAAEAWRNGERWP